MRAILAMLQEIGDNMHKKPTKLMIMKTNDQPCSSQLILGFLERGKGDEQVSCWRKFETRPRSPLKIPTKVTT